jgi:Tol biopolymer transport system component
MRYIQVSVIASTVSLLALPLLSHAAGQQATVTAFVPDAIASTARHNIAPAFAPDGQSVYFTEATDEKTSDRIVVSRWAAGHWLTPQTAPFSGHDCDLEPAFAPSGKYLIFASNRSVTPSGRPLDGHYNGKLFPSAGGHLWKVALKNGAWQKPRQLSSAINVNDAVFSPAVTADGSLYFMRADDGGGVFHIYRSQFRHGRYETPVRAAFSNTTFADYDPAVAPDESFLIFSSSRPPAPHVTDLFIVFRTANGWSDPVDLRVALSGDVHGIEARLSPDLKTLYFTGPRPASAGGDPNTGTILKVSLARLLASHGLS